MQGALFFYNQNVSVKEQELKKPLGILFLTSLRDIALEEYNGRYINIDTKKYYMEGIIESTVKETHKGGRLEGIVEVKGVIVDDLPSDLKNRFPVLPTKGQDWIHPLGLKNSKGELMIYKTWNIPSLFRKLPKGEKDDRDKAKFNFEYQVLQKAKEVGADIIVSDSYMAIIKYLITDLGMNNKVLNIHPGPTLLNKPFCFRGSDPIKAAVKFAEKSTGLVYTGATLHFVDSLIDNGNYIAYICNTPVIEKNELALMYKNYKNAKLPIFIEGIKHYALKIYPFL